MLEKILIKSKRLNKITLEGFTQEILNRFLQIKTKVLKKLYMQELDHMETVRKGRYLRVLRGQVPLNKT